MYSFDELNSDINKLFVKLWNEEYTPKYKSTSNNIDGGSYLGSEEFYVDENLSEIIPYIATNIILLNEQSNILQIHVRRYLNDTNITNDRILNRHADDIEATEYYFNILNTFMKDNVEGVINKLDTEYFKNLCYNKSRRFIRAIELQKNRQNVEMRHIRHGLIQTMEEYIEYQLLKGAEYEQSYSKSY